MTLNPFQTWIATGDGALHHPGRGARPLQGRDSLVYGSYEPTVSTAGRLTSKESLNELNSPTATTFQLVGGQLYENALIHGKVLPPANGDVELRNFHLDGPSTALASGNDGVLNMTGAHTGIVRAYDGEIAPQKESAGRNCALGGNFELHRVWCHGGEDGVGIYPASGNGTAANVKVKGCITEDMAYTYPDRDHTDGSHADGIQIQGGTNIEIVGNSLRGTGHWVTGSGTYYTANPTSSNGDWTLTKSPARNPGAILIIQNNVSAPFDSTVIIDANYFRYGGKSMLLIKSTANNFRVTNNKFSSIETPGANVNGTVYNGVTLAFTYNPYFIRFDAIGTSNNITGLVSSGALANTTNVWLDGGGAGTVLTMPRANGVTSDV